MSHFFAPCLSYTWATQQPAYEPLCQVDVHYIDPKSFSGLAIIAPGERDLLKWEHCKK